MTIDKMNPYARILIVLPLIALGTIVANDAVLSAEKKELNVLSWCDHKDPALLRPFERKMDTEHLIGSGTFIE